VLQFVLRCVANRESHEPFGGTHTKQDKGVCRGRGFMRSVILGAAGAMGASGSHCNTLPHTAATHCCNTLHHADILVVIQQLMSMRSVMLGAATHCCNTLLQHSASH